jgi:PqqD family protein of HPr-rel-A system
MAGIYVVAPPSQGTGRFKFAELSDVTAAYDRASGRTHILDPLSAAILRALPEVGPSVAPESVLSRIADRLGLEGAERDSVALGASLERLRSAGLA